MSKRRHIPKTQPDKKVVPFDDAEEAWFWYIRSKRARIDGAKLTGDYSNETRPCEPDDLYRVVIGLRRMKRLRDEHLRVLAHFGWRESPPDPRVREEGQAVLLWDEAIDRLTTPLIAKGIVCYDDESHPSH